MTETNTTARPTYRVAGKCVTIQLSSRNPGAGNRPGFAEGTNRTLYSGDILPNWVSNAEIAHLIGVGCIETVQ